MSSPPSPHFNFEKNLVRIMKKTDEDTSPKGLSVLNLSIFCRPTSLYKVFNFEMRMQKSKAKRTLRHRGNEAFDFTDGQF